jgi:hypothetical protein
LKGLENVEKNDSHTSTLRTATIYFCLFFGYVYLTNWARGFVIFDFKGNVSVTLNVWLMPCAFGITAAMLIVLGILNRGEFGFVAASVGMLVIFAYSFWQNFGFMLLS